MTVKITRPSIPYLEAIRRSSIFVPGQGKMQGHQIAEALDNVVQWTTSQLKAVQDSIPSPSTPASSAPATTQSSGGIWMAQPTRVVLASSVGITQNALTQILKAVVNFPASGATWCADIRYAMFAVVGANVLGTEVHDGQGNVFAVAQRNSNGSGEECITGSELSATTYAPGSQATFTLYATCNVSGTSAYPNEQISMGLTGVSFLSITPIRIA